MKKLFLIIVAFTFQIGFCQTVAKSDVEQLIIGRWAGIDNDGYSAVFTFEEEKFVTFSSKSRTYGGKEYKGDDNVTYCYKYKIHPEKNPVQIDLILFNKDENKIENVAKSAIRFLDDDILELRYEYSKKLSGKTDENTFVFKRIKH